MRQGVIPFFSPFIKKSEEKKRKDSTFGTFCDLPYIYFIENHFRDAHDTFFISDPATSRNFPSDYLERVKKVHSEGGYDSQGYGYDWKIDEASKNLLR